MSAPSTEPPPDAPKRQRPTLAQRLLLSSDAMLGDLPDPQERLQLERQLVHRLLRAKREVLVSSAVVGPLLVLWLTLPELGWARTVIPLALLLALSGERMLLLRRAERALLAPGRLPRQWAEDLAWRGWLSGLVMTVWSGFVVASGNEELITNVVALAAILGAGGAVSFCSWPPVMWAAMSPIVLGMALNLALIGNSQRLVSAIFLAFLWLVLGLAGMRFGRVLRNDLLTRLRNEKLVARLQAQQAELEHTLAARARFFAAASHDLRQPLQAMTLYASVLDEQRPAPEIVHRLNDCMKALERLLERVLDLTRLDSGELQVQPRAVALQPLLQQLANLYRTNAERKGLTLRVRATAHWSYSDPVLLQAMLGNLLTNAIRYTQRGGILLAVRQRQTPTGPALQLCVLDTGIGIAPESQALVFEEFVQLGNPERNPDAGYGLGLPTVQRMAALLGHQVLLRSRPGRGSCFALQLPWHGPAPAAVGQALRQRRQGRPGAAATTAV